MSGLVGKTIARVEDYGDEIYFTDGTALRISSDDGHYTEYLDQAVTNAYLHEQQGRRERNRLQRLQRLEMLSVSCEERGRRRVEREAKMSPLALMMERELGSCRSFLLTPSQYQRLCPVCLDPGCENTEIVPATIDFGTTTFTIPRVSPKRKARRS